jgi:hypothetical protein
MRLAHYEGLPIACEVKHSWMCELGLIVFWMALLAGCLFGDLQGGHPKSKRSERKSDAKYCK